MCMHVSVCVCVCVRICVCVSAFILKYLHIQNDSWTDRRTHVCYEINHVSTSTHRIASYHDDGNTRGERRGLDDTDDGDDAHYSGNISN